MRHLASAIDVDASDWHWSEGDVQRDILVVYCLTDRLDDVCIHAAGALLSDEERARRDRLVQERDRRDYVAAHAMLRRSLSLFGGCAPHEWTVSRDGSGRPTLGSRHGERASRLSFNLTHADGLVACIVALDVAVGVDAEAIDPQMDVMAVARDHFARVEIEALDRCAANQRAALFIEFWTLKEAYAKALGYGLSKPLDRPAFVFEEIGALRVFEEENGPASACALFAPTARHRMAVVVCGAAFRRRLVVREAAWQTLPWVASR